jgi:hypothetical protein
MLPLKLWLIALKKCEVTQIFVSICHFYFAVCSVVLFYILCYIGLFSCHFIVNLRNTIPWICGVFDEEMRGG